MALSDKGSCRMLGRAGIVLIVLIYLEILTVQVDGRRNILLKKYENCDPNPNYALKLNLTIRTIDNAQHFDGPVILTSPFDDSLRSNVSVDILTGKNYVYLFSINERKSCEAMHKYLGEFIYDLERQAQIIPRLCPIAKGKYHLHNARLDFEKITTLNNFPFGSLRFTHMMFDKENNLYTCVVAEIDNHL